MSAGFRIPDKDVLEKATVQPIILKYPFYTTSIYIFREYMSNDLQSDDFFGLESLVKVEDMFNARMHLGHKAGFSCFFFSPFDKKNKIFSLDGNA